MADHLKQLRALAFASMTAGKRITAEEKEEGELSSDEEPLSFRLRTDSAARNQAIDPGHAQTMADQEFGTAILTERNAPLSDGPSLQVNTPQRDGMEYEPADESLCRSVFKTAPLVCGQSTARPPRYAPGGSREEHGVSAQMEKPLSVATSSKDLHKQEKAVDPQAGSQRASSSLSISMNVGLTTSAAVNLKETGALVKGSGQRSTCVPNGALVVVASTEEPGLHAPPEGKSQSAAAVEQGAMTTSESHPGPVTSRTHTRFGEKPVCSELAVKQPPNSIGITAGGVPLRAGSVKAGTAGAACPAAIVVSATATSVQKEAEQFLMQLSKSLKGGSGSKVAAMEVGTQGHREKQFVITFEDEDEDDDDDEEDAGQSVARRGEMLMQKSSNLSTSRKVQQPGNLRVEIDRMRKQIAAMEKSTSRALLPVSRGSDQSLAKASKAPVPTPQEVARTALANSRVPDGGTLVKPSVSLGQGNPTAAELAELKRRIAAKETEVLQLRQQGGLVAGKETDIPQALPTDVQGSEKAGGEPGPAPPSSERSVTPNGAVQGLSGPADRDPSPPLLRTLGKTTPKASSPPRMISTGQTLAAKGGPGKTPSASSLPQLVSSVQLPEPAVHPVLQEVRANAGPRESSNIEPGIPEPAKAATSPSLNMPDTTASVQKKVATVKGVLRLRTSSPKDFVAPEGNSGGQSSGSKSPNLSFREHVKRVATMQDFRLWLEKKIAIRDPESTAVKRFELSGLKLEFEHQTQLILDPSALGFSKVGDIIRAMPDVASLETTGPGPAFVIPVQSLRRDLESFLKGEMKRNPQGLDMAQLKPGFESRFRYALDYKSLGFAKLRGLLESMPEIVRVEQGRKGVPDLLYHGSGGLNSPAEKGAQGTQRSPAHLVFPACEKVEADDAHDMPDSVGPGSRGINGSMGTGTEASPGRKSMPHTPSQQAAAKSSGLSPGHPVQPMATTALSVQVLPAKSGLSLGRFTETAEPASQLKVKFRTSKSLEPPVGTRLRESNEAIQEISLHLALPSTEEPDHKERPSQNGNHQSSDSAIGALASGGSSMQRAHGELGKGSSNGALPCGIVSSINGGRGSTSDEEKPRKNRPGSGNPVVFEQNQLEQPLVKSTRGSSKQEGRPSSQEQEGRNLAKSKPLVYQLRTPSVVTSPLLPENKPQSMEEPNELDQDMEALPEVQVEGATAMPMPLASSDPASLPIASGTPLQPESTAPMDVDSGSVQPGLSFAEPSEPAPLDMGKPRPLDRAAMESFGEDRGSRGGLPEIPEHMVPHSFPGMVPPAPEILGRSVLRGLGVPLSGLDHHVDLGSSDVQPPTVLAGGGVSGPWEHSSLAVAAHPTPGSVWPARPAYAGVTGLSVGAQHAASHWISAVSHGTEDPLLRMREEEDALEMELDEAQRHRRQMEIKERMARRALRDAEVALQAANARCGEVAHRRDSLVASIRVMEMQQSRAPFSAPMGGSTFSAGSTWRHLVPYDSSGPARQWPGASQLQRPAHPPASHFPPLQPPQSVRSAFHMLEPLASTGVQAGGVSGSLQAAAVEQSAASGEDVPGVIPPPEAMPFVPQSSITPTVSRQDSDQVAVIQQRSGIDLAHRSSLAACTGQASKEPCQQTEGGQQQAIPGPGSALEHRHVSTKRVTREEAGESMGPPRKQQKKTGVLPGRVKVEGEAREVSEAPPFVAPGRHGSLAIEGHLGKQLVPPAPAAKDVTEGERGSAMAAPAVDSGVMALQSQSGKDGGIAGARNPPLQHVHPAALKVVLEHGRLSQEREIEEVRHGRAADGSQNRKQPSNAATGRMGASQSAEVVAGRIGPAMAGGAPSDEPVGTAHVSQEEEGSRQGKMIAAAQLQQGLVLSNEVQKQQAAQTKGSGVHTGVASNRRQQSSKRARERPGSEDEQREIARRATEIRERLLRELSAKRLKADERQTAVRHHDGMGARLSPTPVPGQQEESAPVLSIKLGDVTASTQGVSEMRGEGVALPAHNGRTELKNQDGPSGLSRGIEAGQGSPLQERPVTLQAAQQQQSEPMEALPANSRRRNRDKEVLRRVTAKLASTESRSPNNGLSPQAAAPSLTAKPAGARILQRDVLNERATAANCAGAGMRTLTEKNGQRDQRPLEVGQETSPPLAKEIGQGKGDSTAGDQALKLPGSLATCMSIRPLPTLRRCLQLSIPHGSDVIGKIPKLDGSFAGETEQGSEHPGVILPDRYESPLTCLKAFPKCPRFDAAWGYSDKSLTWENAIDPHRTLCKFEHRGRCNDKECPWQHVTDYSKIESRPLRCGTQPTSSAVAVAEESEWFLVHDVGGRGTEKDGGGAVARSDGLGVGEDDVVPLYALHGGSQPTTATAGANPILFPASRRSLLPGVFCLGRCGPISGHSGAGSAQPESSAEASTWRYYRASEHWLARAETQVAQKPEDVEAWLDLALHCINFCLDATLPKDARDTGLCILARGLEANPHAVPLWVVYLLLYWGRGGSNRDMENLTLSAVQYNKGSYELWSLLVSCKSTAAESAGSCKQALEVLSSEHQGPPELQSAQLLDVALQLLNFLCTANETQSALEWLDTLRAAALELLDGCGAQQTSEQDGSTKALLVHLSSQDAAVLWISSAYVCIYHCLPPAVASRLGCHQVLPRGLDWKEPADAEETAIRQAVSILRAGLDSLQGRSEAEVPLHSPAGMSHLSARAAVAIDYVQALALLAGPSQAAAEASLLLVEHPECLELLSLHAQGIALDGGFTKSRTVWEKAIQQSSQEDGHQLRLWWRYACQALHSIGREPALAILGRAAGVNVGTDVHLPNLRSAFQAMAGSKRAPIKEAREDHVYVFLCAGLVESLQGNWKGALIEAENSVRAAVEVGSQALVLEALAELTNLLYFCIEERLIVSQAERHTNVIQHALQPLGRLLEYITLDPAHSRGLLPQLEPLALVKVSEGIKKPRLQRFLADLVGSPVEDLSVLHTCWPTWISTGDGATSQSGRPSGRRLELEMCLLESLCVLAPGSAMEVLRYAQTLRPEQLHESADMARIWWVASMLVGALLEANKMGSGAGLDKVWLAAGQLLEAGLKQTSAACEVREQAKEWCKGSWFLRGRSSFLQQGEATQEGPGGPGAAVEMGGSMAGKERQ